MNAGAPFPGPVSAAAAGGPLPSSRAFASDWINPRLELAHRLIAGVCRDNADVPGDLLCDLQKAMDKVEEADHLLELQAQGVFG